LGEFGERIGIAFQVIDDILDLEGEAEVVGKSVGRDLAKGKLTLPMILLLDGTDAANFARAVEVFRSRDAAGLLALLRAGDPIDRARDYAVTQIELALRAIDGLDLGGTEDLLGDLARAVISRDR
ncbi:MAG: polyprenyl synthetase family protein, partial [Planctomycetota bacterium]|nr:polyprenyl synthetase family protein [Planctomycetota bacterium]